MNDRGSPPHTRDKSMLLVFLALTVRITPAYAGQIILRPCTIDAQWDHPRIRGTNVETALDCTSRPGSPPHTRDKCGLLLLPLCLCRITPAYAGQINRLEQLDGGHEDHPRIRGTNYTPPTVGLKSKGSPPHTRDK